MRAHRLDRKNGGQQPEHGRNLHSVRSSWPIVQGTSDHRGHFFAFGRSTRSSRNSGGPLVSRRLRWARSSGGAAGRSGPSTEHGFIDLNVADSVPKACQ